MKYAVLGFLLCSTPAFAAELALVGGEVHTVSGAVIPGGTVLVRGERIVAVGKEVAVPSGVQVIDCKGKVVTPGLIESQSAIGMVEISLIDETADQEVQLKDPIRAAVRAADAIDLRSTLVGVARRHGVTSAVAVPDGGLIGGRSAWVDLIDGRSPAAARAVIPDVAMHAVLGELGSMVVGHSRATAVARLLEALDDARTYRTNKANFIRGSLYEMSISRLDAEALQGVLSGQQRLVVAVSRASDISALLALAQREKLKIAILGAEEGWMVSDELARAKVPVIIDAVANLPTSFESRGSRLDNAALLAKAGVEVAIAARSSHNAAWLRFSLGNAVRAGLPHEVALASATRAPAAIYGQLASYGTIDRGKVANLVVWTGDPFEPASYAETVIVRGEVQPVENRQTRLAQKHARRLGLIK